MTTTKTRVQRLYRTRNVFVELLDYEARQSLQAEEQPVGTGLNAASRGLREGQGVLSNPCPPSVVPQQVRETETWMPMNTTMTTQPDDLVSSGDSPNGSDFGFTDDKYTKDDSDDYERFDDEDEEDSEFSGSGDGGCRLMPDVKDNKIPELERPVKPAVNEVDEVRNSNEIPKLHNGVASSNEENLSNVLMSHASDESIFNKTEVLAALIAGGAVGLLFAILLILLLIYRMKKKDEGSYDLGKKPIYKKAPTTEIYA
ncbi:Syndecan-4 [Merluccius polli]|uniref:Syndecan n=1 Tax=Merluccius polli TaxID=89951 RepID=A0AA47NSX4_MERPO|nr:Syndecan-4 [Merluccius polli]